MDKYLREYTTAAERARLESFKRRLRQAASARGYRSLSRVAADAGLAESAIKHYLTGRRLPSAASLVRLSAVLDVPVDWLLGADPPEIAARASSLAHMLLRHGGDATEGCPNDGI